MRRTLYKPTTLITKIRSCFSDEQLQIDHDKNLERRLQDFDKFYKKECSVKTQGWATIEGTEKYMKLGGTMKYDPNHFRKTYGDQLNISSVGIGTYVGAPEREDDLKMFNAIIDSVESGGVNVIDTAINYRYMKSERTVGAALKYLFQNSGIKRENLFVCSKNGFVPLDIDNNLLDTQIVDDLIAQNKIKQEDIKGTVHCMQPQFLDDQLNRSLDNLGLETLDLMYLHNSAEVQMPLIGEEQYYSQLEKVFEFYEQKVQENKIKNYGIASWTCFRAQTKEKNIYVELQKVIKSAEKVAGPNHHLRYIQLPLNIIMHEAFTSNWQNYKNPEDGSKKLEKLLTVARYLNVNVITSSPIWQGALLQVPMPTDIFHCQNLSAKHINFIRSIPSEALKSILVGMKRYKNVQQNLEVINSPIVDTEIFWEFLRAPQESSSESDNDKQ